MAFAETPKLGKLSTSLNVNGICCAMGITSAQYSVMAAPRVGGWRGQALLAASCASRDRFVCSAATTRSSIRCKRALNPAGLAPFIPFYPRPLFCLVEYFFSARQATPAHTSLRARWGSARAGSARKNRSTRRALRPARWDASLDNRGVSCRWRTLGGLKTLIIVLVT